MLWNLPPFKSLPNPREVWGWSMFDLANQSFTLLINTLLFSVYFKEVVVGAATPAASARGDRLWGAIVPISLLVVVAIGPVLGAMADCRGHKKLFLVASGVACGILTCSFGLLTPGAIVLAIALYIPANILYQLGENFLASFLPEVSTPRTIGRISAIGWTSGYVGALMLLIISLAAMTLFGLKPTANWRPLLVFAGVWFLVWLVPSMMFLKEAKPHPSEIEAGTIVALGFKRLFRTIREAKRFGQLARFLLAFFIYGMGVQAVIFLSAIIAKDVIFTNPANANNKLVIFVSQLTVVAGFTAAATSRFQDKIGAKATVIVYLAIWIVSTGSFAILATLAHPPEWLFWTLGSGIGVGIGGIGTASRSMVGRFTPKQQTAEFFGLWGATYKLAGVAGVFTVAQTKAAAGSAIALAVLTAFFVVGLALTLRVNELGGVRSARRAERALARAPNAAR